MRLLRAAFYRFYLRVETRWTVYYDDCSKLLNTGNHGHVIKYHIINTNCPSSTRLMSVVLFPARCQTNWLFGESRTFNIARSQNTFGAARWAYLIYKISVRLKRRKVQLKPQECSSIAFIILRPATSKNTTWSYGCTVARYSRRHLSLPCSWSGLHDHVQSAICMYSAARCQSVVPHDGSLL